MSAFHGSRRGRRNQNWRSNTSGRECRTELVGVPAKACGLIVGKKGRNIKELQEMQGIRYIRVDFENCLVKIVGTDEGIVAAKHRIDQAVVIAVNSDGYFPCATLTCLLLSDYALIKFRRVSKGGACIVRTEQLDANRRYFLFDSLEADLAASMNTLALSSNNALGDGDLVAGFDPSKYMPFFYNAVHANLSHICEDSVSTSIGVNFGKTFVSSVPEEKHTLTFETLNDIGYGKRGLRPEFVRNFHIDKLEFLSRAYQRGYEELSTDNVIVVHCVSQKSKKRYKIKLCPQDSNVDVTSNAIQEIATATTYYSVLGIQTNATLRQIRIAFRRMALAVHPDKSAYSAAEKAMKIVNEAWECLRDSSKRAEYARLSSSAQKPQNSFKYSAAAAEPFPDIESFQSVGRKLALCTVLKAAAHCEFRTTIQTTNEDAIGYSMLRKLQTAWTNRSDDGKMMFPNGTGDWLIIETIRYRKRVTLTNGTFILAMDETTVDHLGKSCDGIQVSLNSYDIKDTLSALSKARDKDSKDGVASRLLSYVRDLQSEATVISSMIDKM